MNKFVYSSKHYPFKFEIQQKYKFYPCIFTTEAKNLLSLFKSDVYQTYINLFDPKSILLHKEDKTKNF